MFLNTTGLDNLFYINFTFNSFTQVFGVGGGILVALALFFTGLFNIFFFSTNLLVTIVFAELMFVGMFIGFVSLAVFTGDAAGLSYGLYLLCSAAVDSAFGLVLTLNTYRLHKSVSFTHLSTLRG